MLVVSVMVSISLMVSVDIFTAVMTPVGVQSAADSLLPIVQSQRERFRLRAQELEAVRTTYYCNNS